MTGPDYFPGDWEGPRRRLSSEALDFERQFRRQRTYGDLDFIEIQPTCQLDAANSYLNHCRPILIVSDTRLSLASYRRLSRWLRQHCPERRQLLASFRPGLDLTFESRGELIVNWLAGLGVGPGAELASRRPADALALGDGTLALLRAAEADPDRFNGLIMVDPPGRLIPESLLQPISKQEFLDDYYRQFRLSLDSGDPLKVDDNSLAAKQMMLRSLAERATAELPLGRWRAGRGLGRLVTGPNQQPADPNLAVAERILINLQAQGMITAIHSRS